jgi:aldehyde:ferredoxin oxidoreductase
MGSKKLKAVVARGTQDIELFDPEKALELCFQANEAGWDSRSANVRKRWGKSYFYGNTNTFGGIRTRNFELNQLVGGDDLECENMDRFAIGREACFGCQQHCRHRFKITVGPFKGAYASGPDYTTIGAVGTELDVRSMDVCLAAGAMCDTYGMDNMGLGSMLSWAMELYEKGIITIKDTGIPLEWGDPDTIFEMIKRIALREGFGDVLADGPEGAIRRIGEESRYYNINMKGMSNMHSDERATPSFALGVATSTRGPDHLRSRPIPDLYGLPEDVLEKMYGGGPMSSDYTSYVGKARMVYSTEIRCASQGLGTCGGTGDMVKAIYYITGMEFTREELLLMGERVYNIERMFNCREGRTRADDYPPERYFTEPSPLGLPKVRGKCLDREKYDQMLDEYYDLHGWDRNGVPTPETLKRLGLDKEPSHLL